MLTLAMAAAVGVSAYWTALASRPVETEPPLAPQPVPGLVPIGAGAHHDVSPAARDRAYVRGRRAGFREGRRAAIRRLTRRYDHGRLAALGGFGAWTPGAAYIVTGASDGKGIRARVGPLVPGARYRLCRDGRRVCVRPPG